MIRPFAIGAAMAAMMLWMLHEPIMSGTMNLTIGALSFVLAHIAVVAAIVALSLFVPRLRKVALKHRPSFGHVAGMALGMIASAGIIHAVMHGVVI